MELKKVVNNKARVIPGFGLSLGVVVTMLSVLVLIPLMSILGYAFRLTLGGLTPAVVRPLVKVTGITVVTKLTAEICKDAKEGGIAGAVETAGTVLALVTAAPLLSAVLDTLAELL